MQVTSRKKYSRTKPGDAARLPASRRRAGVRRLIDGRYAATFRFRDEPRADGAPFIRHSVPAHRFDRVMLVSGDRESEVRYLADQVGINEVHAGQSPEQKLALVRAETRARRTRSTSATASTTPRR